MESGENLNTDINNDNTDFETANGWESLMDDESESVAAFAAHALQKAKARERIEQDQKHSEPETPYKQQRKRIEQNLGHIGTSMLDIRDKTTDRQAVRTEFGAWGVEDGDYEELLRQSDEDYLDDYEADLRERHEKLPFDEVIGKYNGLFTFLGENTTPDPNIQQKYQAISGQKEKLQFILDLPLVDKVKLFCSDNFGYANYDNFMRRLQFQQDFINGTAMVWTNKWDSEQGEYVDVQESLDSDLANPHDISLGLERASLRSAMIGTPEYGAYKMALDFAHSWDYSITSDFPEIKGYWSGIYKNGNGSSIGDWRLIIDEYQKIAEGTAKRRPELQGTDLEYRAVRDAAWIFATSMEYNGTGRGPESPYVSSFHESVAWAQLGQPVRAQLRGMRQKIEGVDLHNIGRFLGRSGLNSVRSSYESEKSRLLADVQNLAELENDGDKDGLERVVRENNEREIQKQNYWQERETTRINHKYDKLISKTRSEERKEEYERRRNSELEALFADCDERRSYYEHRTLEQQYSDLNTRIDIIDRRINKRKSIAEKAIDLHFALLPKYEDEDDDDDDYDYSNDGPRVVPFEVRTNIDWINEAPFGLIRKAHKLLNSGLSQQELVIKAHKTSMDEAGFSKWATDEVAQRMIAWNGGREHFDMAGASRFLKEALGDNFRYEAELEKIGHRLAQNLYAFLPAIESSRDTIPVPQEFFSSDEMTESAIQHLRALTDPSLVNDSLPYQSNDEDRWNGSGVAERLIDGFILPNQPDFFQHDENKVAILRMLRQSAFHMHDAGQFQDIISISEKYLPNEYNEQIQQLREIRDKLKQIEPESGSSWYERRPYENAVGIFAQIAGYDGVDFPDPTKIIQLVENGMNSEDLSRGLGNGFSIEEMVQYPFLCSKLLKEPK